MTEFLEELKRHEKMLKDSQNTIRDSGALPPARQFPKDSPKETLKTAFALIDTREKLYGDAGINFQRIADVASVILGRAVTRYEISVILFSTKIGRMPHDPAYPDSYDDGINYLAFMKMFREEQKP